MVEGQARGARECAIAARERYLALRDDIVRRAQPAIATIADLVEHSLEAAVKRGRPLLGLLPILVATGVGSDLAKRIAAPMWGGLVSLLFVVPAVYVVWQKLGSLADPTRRS